MSKKNFIFLIIFLIVLGFLIFNFRKIEKLKAAPASTIEPNTTPLAIGFPFQRKSFYANGRFWVFYSDGTNMVYNTSTDGSTWSGSTIAKAGVDSGKVFSIWFNGTYLHYAYAPSTGVPNTNLSYRQGIPKNDGTITWSAAEQTVITSSSKPYYPFISVDSSGYVWIGYMEKSGNDYYPYVIKSGNNDGTWGITPAGFPYQLSSISNSDWRVSIIPLTTEKMLAVYALPLDTVKARRWTGSAWGTEKTTTSSITSYPEYHSAVAEGEDVHLLMNTGSAIIYTKYTYVFDTWGPETIIESSVSVGVSPILSINTANNNLYAFWAGYPTADHIYYKKNVAGIWDPRTDWVTETPFLLNSFLTGFYKDYGSKIGLVYMTASSIFPIPGIFSLRFEYLNLPPVIDCGLRVFDGTSVIKIACEPAGTLTSPLRIRKGDTTYGIILVPVTDANASKIRIQTSSGIKALRKY